MGIRRAKDGKHYDRGGFRVTAHILQGPSNDTRSLGDGLRLVIAIPGESFIDRLLGPLVPLTLAAGGAPVAIIGLLSAWAAYLKFCTSSDGEGISLLTRLS